jgi:hypothetical protein
MPVVPDPLRVGALGWTRHLSWVACAAASGLRVGPQRPAFGLCTRGSDEGWEEALQP